MKIYKNGKGPAHHRAGFYMIVEKQTWNPISKI
jgi:hypothetical protein